jgi:hypothetical protein
MGLAVAQTRLACMGEARQTYEGLAYIGSETRPGLISQTRPGKLLEGHCKGP